MNRALVWGLALLGASLALGVAATMGALAGIDATVFKAFALTQAKSADASIAISEFITQIGDPDWRAGIMLVILAVLLYRRQWRVATVYVVTVGLSIAGHSVAKEIFQRGRPDLVPPLDFVDTFSYPSGHAAGAMVILLLGSLLLHHRTLLWASVLLSLAIGVSRVLLGVHWPSDIAGGWMFGSGVALIGYAIAQRGDRRGRRPAS